jgi:hypothetical protein
VKKRKTAKLTYMIPEEIYDFLKQVAELSGRLSDEEAAMGRPLGEWDYQRDEEITQLRQELQRERLHKGIGILALERIATPKRPDGTYNLGREACEQVAREALDAIRKAKEVKS